jgi:hypothetical protein
MPSAPLPLALSESDQPMLVWWVILGMIALGPALHSWIKVIEFFKGKGFDPANFVTQSQMAEMRQERDAQIASTIGSIRDDLNALERTLSELARDLPAIHRALGRLEGHDDAEANNSARRRRPA